jgi:hypothetical protein
VPVDTLFPGQLLVVKTAVFNSVVFLIVVRVCIGTYMAFRVRTPAGIALV